MDNPRFRARGRPSKCPRLEVPNYENVIEVNSDEDMNDAQVTNYGTSGLNLNIAPAQEASEGSDLSAALPGLVSIPAPVAPADGSPSDNITADEGEGVPSGRTVRPRRCPRKGTPRRSPMF